MESFTLTRKQMSDLLLSLQGHNNMKAVSVLQQAWSHRHHRTHHESPFLSDFFAAEVPTVIEKLIKLNAFNGFSLHEIADLGQMIEYSNLSITSIQNWVKRDFKDMFITIKEGRKYSINQAALLFIIDDLKCHLDFMSIRKLFQALFFSKHGEGEMAELIEPVQFYHSYSAMCEELVSSHHQLYEIGGHHSLNKSQEALLEKLVRNHADRIAQQMSSYTAGQQKIISNTLLIATLSVQTSYLQAISKRYYNATVFLDFNE